MHCVAGERLELILHSTTQTAPTEPRKPPVTKYQPKQFSYACTPHLKNAVLHTNWKIAVFPVSATLCNRKQNNDTVFTKGTKRTLLYNSSAKTSALCKHSRACLHCKSWSELVYSLCSSRTALAQVSRYSPKQSWTKQHDLISSKEWPDQNWLTHNSICCIFTALPVPTIGH